MVIFTSNDIKLFFAMKKGFILLILTYVFTFFLFSANAQHNGAHVHDHSLDHELIFRDVKGDTTALSLLHGKVVFINIWAVWCGPCREELPGLNQLYLKYKDDKNVVFLFVDADSNLKKAQRFLDRRIFQIPLYESLNGFPASLFRGAVPTTMVFDREGKVIMYYEGAADYTHESFMRKFDDFVNVP